MFRAPVLLLLGLLGAAKPHPLHTAHIDLVDSGRAVTVAVRAFSDDLLRALARRGRETGDSAMARYIQETLGLRDRSDRAVLLRLERVEIDGPMTWMHFRAEMPQGLSGARILPTMGAELFSDQVNVVRAACRGREQSLLFLPGDDWKSLE